MCSSAGSDFHPSTSSESTFVAASDTGDVYCFTFTILDDPCVEDDEYFSIYLGTADTGIINPIANASVRIVDHDCK